MGLSVGVGVGKGVGISIGVAVGKGVGEGTAGSTVGAGDVASVGNGNVGSTVALGDRSGVGDGTAVASAAPGVGADVKVATGANVWLSHALRTKTATSTVAARLAYLIGFPSSRCTRVRCNIMVGGAAEGSVSRLEFSKTVSPAAIMPQFI